MAEADSKPGSSPQKYVRTLFVIWLYLNCGLGLIGTIVGLIALLAGKLSGNGKPVENFADKLQYTLCAAFFAVVGTVGLIIRYRRRKSEIPKAAS